MNKVIKNVLIPFKSSLEKKDVQIKNGLIKAVSDYIECEDDVINAENKIMVPGFIDCHTHGFLGLSSEEGTALETMSINYAKRGILGFFPTIGPRTDEEYEQIFKVYRDTSEHIGNFLGFHLEGPYLNEDKSGAIDPDKIREIDLKSFETFIKRNQDLLKIMTIAPEIKNGIEAIKVLKKYHVIPSIGHSDANYNEANLAFLNGATQVTHLFNAMSGLHHRNIGVAGAALLNENVYVEMILDGVHISKEMISLALKAKDIKKIIAISDGGKTCGYDYPDGHRFSDGTVVKNGAMINPQTNTLCGSTRDVYSHFKMLINEYGLSIYDATLLTSTNACRHYGLKMGILEPSYEANFLLLDNSLTIQEVYMRGKCVYET